MKKLFYLFLVIPIFAIGQKNNTVSGYFSASQPLSMGISYEFKLFKNSKNNSNFINVGYGSQSVTYSTFLYDYNINGTGYVVAFGSRNYFGKEKKAFYIENSNEYGRINFNDSSTGFNGTYSYFSMINPNIGYKWYAGKNFVIDPYIGFNWKWQIKGQGDIDNNIFNPLVFRVGLKFGFNF